MEKPDRSATIYRYFAATIMIAALILGLVNLLNTKKRGAEATSGNIHRIG